MRIRWTTDRGPDPALRPVFRADRPAAVASAVVGGADVLVTLVDEHEDFDCDLGSLHHLRCPPPGMRVWDRATGRLLRAIPGVCDNGTGHPAVLATVVADGRPLAVVRDWARPPKVVDLETGRRAGILPGHDDAADVQDIVAVPGAAAVATVGWDGMLRVTELETGRTMAVDTGERLNAVTVVRIGERTVAATGRDAVTLWDLADGARVGVLAPATEEVPFAIVSWPDGGPAVAVLGAGGGIRVWDAGTGRSRRLGAQGADIAAVTAADGRRLLAVAEGDAVSLWDVEADEPFGAPLEGPVRHARLFAAGPGMLVIASPADDAVSVWRLDDSRAEAGAGNPATIRCLTVTPDGWIVTGGVDGALRRRRLTDGTRYADIGSLHARVNAVAAIPDVALVHLLAGGGDLNGTHDGRLHRWADGHSRPPAELDHGGEVDVVIPFPLDGEPAVLTAGCDGQVHLTDVRTGQRLGTITGTYQPRGVAVGLLAGRPAAAISWMFGPLAVWDLSSRTEVVTPAAGNVRIGEAARAWLATEAGPAVVTVHEALVRVHFLLIGGVLEVQPGQDEPVTALAATGDTTIAIARTDGSVSVLDVVTGREAGRLALPYAATALAAAPGGLLVVASRRDLYCAELPHLAVAA